MLPSMPILFTRDSQDAFGNKIEPSTSFFSQSLATKPVINPEPPPVIVEEPSKDKKEGKSSKQDDKKKNDGLPEPDEKEFENTLVRAYYSRVQSRFSSNHSVPANKFVQFQQILRDFDPTKETPVDLFKKIEQLFGDEHRDIVEDFLLFLKPSQAAQVGRFMDRSQLVQITGFIEMLHSTFARKPTVLRKVVRAITTGLNTGTIEEARARVLPHFRSHPRLGHMFRSLFPDERPPDSLYETGTDQLTESFLTGDRGYDVWEFQSENDKKPKLETKQRLDTTYLNGRVFLQHGRLLRPARVTFPYSKEPYRAHARRLAPSHCHLSPPHDDDKKTPKRPRKQNKSPTKQTKDVNDNTKKDLKDAKDSSNMSPKPKKQKTKNGKKDDRIEAKKKDKNCVRKDVSIEPKPKQARIETSASEKKDESRVNNWTRDEDKTMLQVLKGEAGSEKVFGRIKELLPHRSPTEIKERFCHVMTLLQQMAVGEVT